VRVLEGHCCAELLCHLSPLAVTCTFLSPSQAASGDASPAGVDSPTPLDDGFMSPKTPGPVTPMPGSDGGSAAAGSPPLTTADLAHAWEKSSLWSELRAANQATAVPELALESPYAKAQYGSSHARSLIALAVTLIKRRE
jgi:hypothetical protein